ncbi:phospholipid-binding protein MlaC [Thalassococcus sp. S3]|uniref:MlaC/ttg2D family ABC transporter substrate-binding protein n=1 Tax=Thalassococcus sp. S3 TaxID=2017482 RepID=UPI0010244CC8|nr:ABC transporter substrate-binding protein [Thalassococcus sp. S3]QBF33150.1 ABC transporter [Thalassococcus sp. S3]
MPSKFFSRRSVLASLAATGLAALPLPAFALSPDSARRLVDQLVAEINSVIASGKSESAMIRDFERIFARYADVPIMARYALGADARRASPAQMRAFTKAFQVYISRKYGRRFREFIGGRIEVQSARQIRSGYEIRSVAFLRGQSPFEVTFLVSDKSGRDLFFNMFIEGVNLLLTERTEIGALLDRRGGNIDAMIADLQAAT